MTEQKRELDKLVEQAEGILGQIGELADDLLEDVVLGTDYGDIHFNHGWQPSGGCEWEESGESGFWSA